MKRRYLVALTSLVLLCHSVGLLAGTVTQTGTFGGPVQTTSFVGQFNFIPYSLVFQQFDPSLGTLNSVAIEYQVVANLLVGQQITNGGGDFVVSALSTLIIGTGVPSSDALMSQHIYGFSASAHLSCDFPCTDESIQPASFGPIGGLLDPVSLPYFIGLGEYSIPLVTQLTQTGGTDNEFANSFAHAMLSGDLMVTYTYAEVAPIPEPETYAMLLAGLGLLGYAARRRKQKEAALA